MALPTNRRREIFNRLIRAREDGLRRLAQAGPQPDPILAQELAQPGSDARLGISLVALPSPEVIAMARAIQKRLQASEPDLYAYPSSDLHLVVLEIGFERREDEIAEMAASMRERLPDLLDSLSPFRLGSPLFHFDERGADVSFLPLDGGLDRLRATLLERMDAGALLQPARAPRQARLALIRYVTLARMPRKEWLELLSQTLAPSELEWAVHELYLISGATAYGRSARILRSGPYRLRSSE